MKQSRAETNEPELLEPAELEQVSGGKSEPLEALSPSWLQGAKRMRASLHGPTPSEAPAPADDSSDAYTISAGPVLTAEQLQARVGQIRF